MIVFILNDPRFYCGIVSASWKVDWFSFYQQILKKLWKIEFYLQTMPYFFCLLISWLKIEKWYGINWHNALLQCYEQIFAMSQRKVINQSFIDGTPSSHLCTICGIWAFYRDQDSNGGVDLGLCHLSKSSNFADISRT